MTHSSDPSALDENSPPRFPDRWRLHRAGIVNVWHYLDVEFVLSGGRMILRGTNGSGKSRALEMLLPFLLDADRRRMDATGAAKVDLDELMRTGASDTTDRVGYLWLELARPSGHFTVGAQVRHRADARRSDVHFFTTPLRVGTELHLVDDARIPLSRERLAELIGADNLTRDPERHRETVRKSVFGLHAETGRERYDGLLQLLHTLRSPDVGHRIDEGRLPQILSDALPPLTENMLAEAGGRLDLLGDTRQEQVRLEAAHAHVLRFHEVYRQYAADLLRAGAETARDLAQRVVETRRALTVAEAEAADLDAQAAAADTRLKERRDQVAELDRAIRGLETHEMFRSADDLAQRQLAVDALRRAAEHATAAADRSRMQERRHTDHAARLLDELTFSVTRAARRLATVGRDLLSVGLPHDTAPTTLHFSADRPPAVLEPVRTGIDDTTEQVVRPVVATVSLDAGHVDEVRDAILRAAEATRRRRDQAGRRLLEARRLDAAAHAVREAEAAADRAARDAEQRAVEAAETDAGVGAAAAGLQHRWREWITADRTTALLPELDRDRVILMRRLSTRLDALIDSSPTDAGDTDSEDVDVDSALAELDSLPTTAARSALSDLAGAPAERERREREARTAREDLVREQAALDAIGEGPEQAPWHVRTDGVPLWRAVEFVDTLGDDDRAGIEAALLSAGFLTATVDGEGRLRALGGQVLVSPRGEPPAQPLSTVLRPDPEADVPRPAIEAVLNTIGFEDATAVASVSRDGRWHNGVLRGRHTAEAPRSIGSPAREAATAARRVRLDEIRAELIRIDLAVEQLRVDYPDAAHRRAEIDAHLSTAPTSHALRAALERRRHAYAHVRSAANTAVELRERATTLRARWTAELDAHRTACEHFGVPGDVPELEALVAGCASAETLCTELARDLGDVLAAHVRFTDAAERCVQATAERIDSEEIAESCRYEWHAKAAVVAAQTAAVDVDAADLAQELRDSEAERARADEQFRRTVAHRDHLGRAVAEVLQRCAAARERLDRDRRELAAAAELLAAHLQLPELRGALEEDPESDSASARTVLPPVHLEDPDHVLSVARTLLATLPPRTGVDENAMLVALQQFDRDLTARFDIEHTVTHGAHRVRIAGAGDDTTPAGLSVTLTRQVEDGRRALSQREHDVFTGFVLGGVADELRRRIERARQVIAAMNDSLADSRTTHGIGVRIEWRPGGEDADAARLTQLLTATERSPEDASELVGVLRRRVESAHTADPSAGYAQHLSQALDYRRWHEVEVTILGPEPDRERRISARAKISQGETRFVSYVALFAAADGYLSGLPDTGTALRLVLLDDAFAKIDDPTIGELMGLLVRQDIDFVMTGHALWGCVPEVPELDVYEVRRLADGAAVTTRVHWDGRVRQLRPLTELQT
ncbi:TIGR02680 family protein [Rhodococcus pyridinivorans]|uniref:TIGR02680 family protein n=1 Tax=Rhodococcus pyridinivorans TaxID=103816 RepID=UPI0007CD48CC|nr:TIGR02680 family protein [Rhodococcus pyridinivorans]SED31159.1 TIGR02680 family protein [Rhodococcus pyridinivorans]